MMLATEQLTDIETKLAALQAGQIRTTELTDAARASSSLLCSLPPKFEEVLNNILDRLESSALFTEESCSFSQSGLLDNLAVWIDKAKLRLQP
jgi:hypothetical protein